LIDAQQLPSPRESIRFGSAAGKHGPDHGFLNWGEPFCPLLDHEAIMPILRLRLGDCFRLDRLYGIRMHKGQTMGSIHADYGASALNSFVRPGERFHFAPNGIYNYTGHPALALPVGKSPAGLPVSMQLVGRFFDDPLIMRVAYAYQHATDWDKIIGVHA
jgi:hypothetical protein